MSSSEPRRPPYCVVSADPALAARWDRVLRARGWRGGWAATLAAFRRAAGAGPGLALIDCRLLVEHPARTVKSLRSTAPAWLFALVAGAGESFGAGGCLEWGGDDVISASAGDAELAARAERLVAAGGETVPTTAGDLRVDPASRSVWARARTRWTAVRGFTAKEFDLLCLLVGHAGRAWSREELLDALWRERSERVNTETVDRHVGSLRRKLGRRGAGIRTVHGIGYRFEPPSGGP